MISVEVENVVVEQYMMMQKRVLCIQTNEQECLYSSVKYIAALQTA